MPPRFQLFDSGDVVSSGIGAGAAHIAWFNAAGRLVVA